MSKEYVLIERKSHPGRNGTTMWRFTWYCLDDGNFYETTADDTYDNFRRSGWNNLSTDPNPWGIYTGLTRTRRKTADNFPVITADSRPTLQSRCEDWEEALKIICEHKGVPFPGSRNQYPDFFE